MTTVAIMQPSYWARCHKWNRIVQSDIFVWLDNVKFSRTGDRWEDRTLVEQTDGRTVVLRLPMQGSRNDLWREVGVNPSWRKHRSTIVQCYSKQPFWKEIEPEVELVYAHDAQTIEEVCWRTFRAVTTWLELDTVVVTASDLLVDSSKGQLVLDIVKKVGGDRYLSGEPGSGYLPVDRFREAGIEIAVQRWHAPTTPRGMQNPSIVDLVARYGSKETMEILEAV